MSEYAPQYTKKERFVLLLKMLAWVIPVYIAMKFWFFDWLAEYAANANCHKYGTITGVHLIFYGIFVFVPLSFALAIFLVEGKRCLKIIKLGQNPLPNEKVFRPTKYKYGAAAKAQPIVIMASIIALLGLSIWGGFQAHKWTRHIKPCAVDKSYNQIGADHTPPG